MSGICPELDARLSAELDRYYFSTDGSGLNLDRREKHRVINALHRLWNIEEIACYGVGFATEDVRKVILDLMKPAHIRLALKTVDFNSGAAYSLWLGCALLCLQNLMRISNMKSGKEFSVADICLWLWRVFFPK